MALIRNQRRYYLRKRIQLASFDEALAAVYQAKQEAVASTALPNTFPALTELTAAGYTTEADLDGADEDELVEIGLTRTQAKAAIAAFNAL